MEGQYNLRSPAVKRLMKEAQELREPNEQFYAQPLDDNLFEWHFTIRGPVDSEFEKGIYHGRIILPPEYPMKPPSIILLTPNGRFETNKKICLSISGHHPESWQPSWSLRTALLAIIGFMPTHGNGAIGSLDYTEDERKQLAKRSLKWECPHCGAVERLLRPVTEASKALSQEAKVLGSQINLLGEKEKSGASESSSIPSAGADQSPSSSLIGDVSSPLTVPNNIPTTSIPMRPPSFPFPPFDPNQMLTAGQRFPMMMPMVPPCTVSGIGGPFPTHMSPYYNQAMLAMMQIPPPPLPGQAGQPPPPFFNGMPPGSFMSPPLPFWMTPGFPTPPGMSGFPPTMPGFMQAGFPQLQQPSTASVGDTTVSSSTATDVVTTTTCAIAPTAAMAGISATPTMMSMMTLQDAAMLSHSGMYATSRMRASTSTSHSEACAGRPNTLANEGQSNAEVSSRGTGHTGGVHPAGDEVKDDQDHSSESCAQEEPVLGVSTAEPGSEVQREVIVNAVLRRLSKETSAELPAAKETKEEASADSSKDSLRGSNAKSESSGLPVIQGNSPCTPCVASRQINATFHPTSTAVTPSGTAGVHPSITPFPSSTVHVAETHNVAEAASSASSSASTDSPSSSTEPKQKYTAESNTVEDTSASELRQRRPASSPGIVRATNQVAELPREHRVVLQVDSPGVAGRVSAVLLYGFVALLIICIIALLYRRLVLLA